jgi:hypothetical protein
MSASGSRGIKVELTTKLKTAKASASEPLSLCGSADAMIE